MSVQSESGRLDYSKSDTSPKKTRLAGELIDLNPILGAKKSDAGSLGQYRNERSVESPLDFDKAPDTTFLQRKIEQLKGK